MDIESLFNEVEKKGIFGQMYEICLRLANNVSTAPLLIFPRHIAHPIVLKL